MNARKLSTLLMMASAFIVSFTPNVAHAASFPSLIGAFKSAVKSVMGVLWPQTFEDLGLSDPARWGLTLLVAGLTAYFIMRIIKPPKEEGKDMLGYGGAIALAFTLMSVLAMLAWNLGIGSLYYFFFTWELNLLPTLGKMNPNAPLTFVIKGAVFVGILIGLWAGGATLLKKTAGGVWDAAQSIWKGVMGSAGSGKETFWRLFGALFFSSLFINNQHASNAQTSYAPSILFSLLGLGVLSYDILFRKTEAGDSFFSRFGAWRTARKAAKAQATPVVAQAVAVAPVATAPTTNTLAVPPQAQIPQGQELKPHQRSYLRV